MREYCPLCKQHATPWFWISLLKQHGCADCYFDNVKCNKKIKKEYLRRLYHRFGKLNMQNACGYMDWEAYDLMVDENRYNFFNRGS